MIRTRHLGFRPTSLAISALCTLALAGPASAQIGSGKGPIDITADEVEFVDDARTLRWSGRVDAVQAGSRLRADRMDVIFNDSDANDPSAIRRIVAEGSVAYITPTETARGDRGVYDAADDRITITGDVVLIRGANTSTGAMLVVEPGAGRARLVSANASRGIRGSEDRVRGVYFPEDDE